MERVIRCNAYLGVRHRCHQMAAILIPASRQRRSMVLAAKKPAPRPGYAGDEQQPEQLRHRRLLCPSWIHMTSAPDRIAQMLRYFIRWQSRKTNTEARHGLTAGSFNEFLANPASPGESRYSRRVQTYRPAGELAARQNPSPAEAQDPYPHTHARTGCHQCQPHIHTHTCHTHSIGP